MASFHNTVCVCVPYANTGETIVKENPECSLPSHIYVSGSFADSMAKKKFCKDILIEQESMKG